jgi:hypothetical protein
MAADWDLVQGTSGQWRRIVDTSLASPNEIAEGDGQVVDSAFCHVPGRRVVVSMR